MGRSALEALDFSRAVAVLPIAASEQHGPHLPFGVDCIINQGLLELVAERWREEHATGAETGAQILELPLLPIGKVAPSSWPPPRPLRVGRTR